MRTFATRYFASQSANHMVQFPRISLVPSLPSVPVFFAPLPSLIPPISISLAFVVDLVSLLLPWHGYEGQTRIGEFRAKPWPTKGDVSKSGGSLAILTSPQSPNTNARLLWTSSCWLLPVMEKGVTTLSSNPIIWINLKDNHLLFLFPLNHFIVLLVTHTHTLVGLYIT